MCTMSRHKILFLCSVLASPNLICSADDIERRLTISLSLSPFLRNQEFDLGRPPTRIIRETTCSTFTPSFVRVFEFAGAAIDSGCSKHRWIEDAYQTRTERTDRLGKVCKRWVGCLCSWGSHYSDRYGESSTAGKYVYSILFSCGRSVKFQFQNYA